ncbi:SIR2 family NAD-dependent protein deacylase [Streptococcus moroccensis]|uniref:protein acetyllysine N-acetyltransferase n=1 Tax=Streptococcus moroccensis TaxID=1451356 RepID=A0ABT9YRR9_9STRE|nr:Sir2 family NAD-dependent protein deacetylase [Streptococcus moroccensis]MDQ0222307.1 NAD-dependent SIR2 family protein deacetylase [Streptococcus moroccensis]
MLFQKNALTQAKKAIDQADLILIGAGAGLSEAAGLHYAGERFETLFADYIAAYGLTDMFTATFYPYPTPETKWAFWARHIYYNAIAPEATALYKNLFQLVKDKPHFVITTNVDSQFTKAGFASDSLFEVQGNYELWQCSIPCQQKTYANTEQVLELFQATQNLEIPSQLIPHCPDCGAEMMPHLRSDNRFVQDESWHQALKRYGAFIEQFDGKRIVLLELGVGFNTPDIIRFPFERLTQASDHATLIRLNRDFAQGYPENAKKTLSFKEDMTTILASWLER